MHEVELTPAEERMADALTEAFSAIATAEGNECAAKFVVATAMKSEEIIVEAEDAQFLVANNIDPTSLR